MIKEDIRFTDSTVMEGMTSISALLSAKAAGINDREIKEIRFDRAKTGKKARELTFLNAKCRELGVPLTLTDAKELEALCIGNTHGGVIAICGDRTLPEPSSESLLKNGFYCLLEGIEDPYNFGYAVRSLYAAGCDGIFLGKRNWMSAAGVVARSSAGASEALPVYSGDPVSMIEHAKKAGYTVVCAGIKNAVSVYEASLKRPLLLIVGGEKRGVSAAVAAQAQQTVRIDYGRGFRGSLSAASAATVLGFEVLRQNRV
ncbi:MAG: RNA methyltransferase [Ruminococcaceae bacterium]|nr:RNA methyltransferase [Oscillospiraceae bacterium]